MKSSYALTASSPDGSKRSPRFEQIKNNEALLKNRQKMLENQKKMKRDYSEKILARPKL